MLCCDKKWIKIHGSVCTICMDLVYSAVFLMDVANEHDLHIKLCGKLQRKWAYSAEGLCGNSSITHLVVRHQHTLPHLHSVVA